MLANRTLCLLVGNLFALNPKNNSTWDKNACSFPLPLSNGSDVLIFKGLIMTGAGASISGANAGACPQVFLVVDISKPVSKGR